jgi:hypothetical protein
MEALTRFHDETGEGRGGVSMKKFLVALGLLAIPVSASFTVPSVAQQNVAQIAFQSVPDYPKLPDGMNFGEGARRCGELERACLRVHALQQRSRSRLCADRSAIARVRSERNLPARDRQRTLRLVVRPFGAYRQGRQYLGHR